MALNAMERAEFVNTYTRVLITAWSSEDFSNRLAESPKIALAEVGLSVPAEADVEIIRTVTNGSPEATLDSQVSLWETGIATGHYELYVPDAPQIEMAELSEGDLDAVAAGLSVTVACCCTPCCSCT
jgi:hypothetical protein